MVNAPEMKPVRVESQLAWVTRPGRAPPTPPPPPPKQPITLSSQWHDGTIRDGATVIAVWSGGISNKWDQLKTGRGAPA